MQVTGKLLRRACTKALGALESLAHRPSQKQALVMATILDSEANSMDVSSPLLAQPCHVLPGAGGHGIIPQIMLFVCLGLGRGRRVMVHISGLDIVPQDSFGIEQEFPFCPSVTNPCTCPFIDWQPDRHRWGHGSFVCNGGSGNGAVFTSSVRVLELKP